MVRDVLFRKHVSTGLHHFAHAAAVLCCIAKAHQRDAVDTDPGAAFNAYPGIGTATRAVHARVAHTERGFAVDEDVGRGRDGRAGDVVGATVFAVDVGRTVAWSPRRQTGLDMA